MGSRLPLYYEQVTLLLPKEPAARQTCSSGPRARTRWGLLPVRPPTLRAGDPFTVRGDTWQVELPSALGCGSFAAR